MSAKPKISDAEWTVMNVLWDKSPATANQIIDVLGPGANWKPKTVRTLINRLVAKGAVAFEKVGRQYNYRPLLSRDECIQDETTSFIARTGAEALKPMLAAFIEEHNLGLDEIEELKQILDRKGAEQ